MHKIWIYVKINLIIFISYKLQVMVVAKTKKVSDLLKEEILEKEDKREYFSDKFKKIEDQVKKALIAQKTDDALRDITI
ncbi:hypothetical protein HOF65_05820 [bacterium]|nr:hypothetical protein [bacterium]MBT3853453.1 hypothetical protein [bacterium]MBT4632746.1 hypothetical protein [bacterium]MBT5491742.1 hypothetical protein [bacterium]MBT6778940.1 hypothetical protein [bacterium]